MNRSTLLLVDIQNDFFCDGLWPVDDMENVAAAAARALKQARGADDLVVHIRHEATSAAAPFFHPGSGGADIHCSVAPREEEAVIVKHRPNSFHETALHARLQAAGVGHLSVVGAMTQMCIDATVRAARDLGYSVTIFAEGCGAKSQKFGNVTVSVQEVEAAFLGALSMSYADVV